MANYDQHVEFQVGVPLPQAWSWRAVVLAIAAAVVVFFLWSLPAWAARTGRAGGVLVTEVDYVVGSKFVVLTWIEHCQQNTQPPYGPLDIMYSYPEDWTGNSRFPYTFDAVVTVLQTDAPPGWLGFSGGWILMGSADTNGKYLRPWHRGDRRELDRLVRASPWCRERAGVVAARAGGCADQRRSTDE